MACEWHKSLSHFPHFVRMCFSSFSTNIVLFVHEQATKLWLCSGEGRNTSALIWYCWWHREELLCAVVQHKHLKRKCRVEQQCCFVIFWLRSQNISFVFYASQSGTFLPSVNDLKMEVGGRRDLVSLDTLIFIFRLNGWTFYVYAEQWLIQFFESEFDLILNLTG